MYNKNFVSFLEKYTEYNVPSEITLRNNYVKNLHKSTINHIKNCVHNYFLWISIDETTDTTERYVANVIIGTLGHDKLIAKQKFVLNTLMPRQIIALLQDFLMIRSRFWVKV